MLRTNSKRYIFNMSLLFYAVKASGKVFETFAGAKVQ